MRVNGQPGEGYLVRVNCGRGDYRMLENARPRTELTGRTNWNPGNGGCTDFWLRAEGTGLGVVGGPLGAGPGEREGRGPGTCLFVGGRTPADRGRCGPGGPDAAAVGWDRACAWGGGGRVCAARIPS